MSLQASSPASQDTANFQAMSGTTENRPTDKSEAMDEWNKIKWDGTVRGLTGKCVANIGIMQEYAKFNIDYTI